LSENESLLTAGPKVFSKQRRALSIVQAIALASWACCAASHSRAEIIDRVAAVVGRAVITESDVQKEAALEAYFDSTPPPALLGPQTPQHRQVLERLIRQHLIRHEMEQSRFPSATDEEAQKELQILMPVRADPEPYGLKDQDLLDYARRLVDTSRFLELRLTPTTLQTHSAPGVTRKQIEDYYKNVFVPEQNRKGAAAPPIDDVRRQIETDLQEDKELDDWLQTLRSAVGVRIVEPERP
jgi:hypothetical protein